MGSLNGNGQSLALHWNGSIWSRSATPSPDAYENFLNGVLAMSSNNVWAVGQSGLESFVVHWNGGRWWWVVGNASGETLAEQNSAP